MARPGYMIPMLLGKLTKKPVTVMYPYEKLEPFKDIRAKIKFDTNLCIGCSICAKDCPSGACYMVDIPNPVDKKKKTPHFDLDMCTFCGQCEESCPKDAIKLTDEYEMAHFKRGELIIK